MLTAHRYCPGGSLLVLLVLACNGSELVEPANNPTSTAAVGSTVKPPSSITAAASSESRIDVSWQDNSGNETGFEVHRSTNGGSGPFGLQTSTGASAVGYSDAGLTASTQYCYKVRAFRKAGSKTSYSAFSSTACATTQAPPIPAAPTAADVTPWGSTVVNFRWTDNSVNEAGFRVERLADGGTSWAAAAITDANIESLLNDGRTPDQEVCYRVIAFNSIGDSPPSNTDCTAPPAGPTDLTATRVPETGEVDLAWVDNSAVEDGYEVFGYDGFGSYILVTSLPANSTTFRSWPGFNAFVVQATKDSGFSDQSNTANLDCDGSECQPGCSGDIDCVLGEVCGPAQFCVSHCGDGLQNRDETDVDCGGDGCEARCAAGQHCGVHADCASGNCGIESTCQP